MFSAYCKYAQLQGVEVEILDSRIGQVLANISGKKVWSLFQFESGKHVIQRESAKKHHTSVVSVCVLPLKDKTEYKPLLENDLSITTMRGSGPGGQHRNKTESCVRVVHKPTGINAVVDGRDQSFSKKEAIRIVTARVHEACASVVDKKYDADRKSQLFNSGRGGDKVRTYNLIKSFARDHRTGKETKNVSLILQKGRFDLIL